MGFVKSDLHFDQKDLLCVQQISFCKILPLCSFGHVCVCMHTHKHNHVFESSSKTCLPFKPNIFFHIFFFKLLKCLNALDETFAHLFIVSLFLSLILEMHRLIFVVAFMNQKKNVFFKLELYSKSFPYIRSPSKKNYTCNFQNILIEIVGKKSF